VLAVSKARDNFFDLMEKTMRLHERFIITKKGKPEAVLISAEEYEEWMETLEIMSYPETVKGIKKGLKELKKGETRSYKEVFGEPLNAKR
jgi:prevent-host-death family protein